MTVYEVESYRTDSYYKGVASVELYANKTDAEERAAEMNADEELDEYSTVRYRVVNREVY